MAIYLESDNGCYVNLTTENPGGGGRDVVEPLLRKLRGSSPLARLTRLAVCSFVCVYAAAPNVGPRCTGQRDRLRHGIAVVVDAHSLEVCFKNRRPRRAPAIAHSISDVWSA